VAASRQDKSVHRVTRRDESGQALIEFALIALIMVGLVFGLIDISRAIYEKQVMINLTREGSNLASRGTSLSDTALAVVNGDEPLDIASKGMVIVTSVQNDGTNCRVVDQFPMGGLKGQNSKLGKKGGSPFPCMNSNIPQPNQTAFVTEVFYTYEPVTPVGKLLTIVMPPTLYDVAYF
jgi:Flp pilus assembly pilin Flp